MNRAPLLAAASFCLLLRCASPTAGLSVLLVTIDTLRHDRLGFSGWPSARTPHLDALAASGVAFLETVAPTPLTLPSHASLMLGLPPTAHGVLDNASFRVPQDSGPTLAERLRRAGLRTAAVIAAQPLARGCGLERGFERYDDRLPPSSTGTVRLAERDAATVTDAALDALRSMGSEAFFLWVHYFDPHAPYAPPAEFLETGLDPYDGEIAFVDRELGRLLEAVDRDRTLVVVTSDHGESLGEHGEDAHGFLLHEATVRVPLVVADPSGAQGLVVREQVQLVDLADWISGRIAGSAPPCEEALTARARAGDPALLVSSYGSLHCGWAQLRGLRFPDGWKYLESCAERLFFLPDDPHEERDLSGVEPERTERARRSLARRIAGARPAAPLTERSLPGYLSAPTSEGAAFPSRERNCERPSIFERGPVLRALQDGIRYLESGLPAAATRSLEEAARKDPGNPSALFWLARARIRLAATGEGEAALQAARDALRATLELRPRLEKAAALLLYVETQLGAWDEARALADRLLGAEHPSPRSLEAVAILHLTREAPFGADPNPFYDPERAVALLERAARESDDERIRRRLAEARRRAGS